MDGREIPLVLAQPTRATLLGTLKELGRPVSTGELAERAGLHPNGVRNHLEILAEAGLVERGRSSGGRGRPRDEWRAASGTPADDAQANGDLARWLLRGYPSGEAGLLAAERAGREAGLEISPRFGEARESFIGELNALGFAPEVEERGSDGFNCRLGHCPYREAVHENQPLVCALHRGLTRGLLESADSRYRLVEFVPHDPDRAGCLIGVERSG